MSINRLVLDRSSRKPSELDMIDEYVEGMLE